MCSIVSLKPKFPDLITGNWLRRCHGGERRLRQGARNGHLASIGARLAPHCKHSAQRAVGNFIFFDFGKLNLRSRMVEAQMTKLTKENGELRKMVKHLKQTLDNHKQLQPAFMHVGSSMQQLPPQQPQIQSSVRFRATLLKPRKKQAEVIDWKRL